MIDQDVRAALSFIPAEDREVWVRMAMAVKAALGDAGFDLWDAWSQTSDAYKERDAREVWKSVKPDGGIGAGSLFHEAKAQGWNGTPPTFDPPPKADVEKAKRERQADYDHVARRAQRIYDEAQDAPASAPYFKRKGILPPDGVKSIQGLSSTVFGFDSEWMVSCLLVPMRSAKGEMRSLQLIPDRPDQKKLFMKGGQAGGCFHVMGDLSERRILIAEGLATAQSGREASGWTAVVAFSANNLPAVADIVRQRNATAEILILADDDEAGRKAAGRCNEPAVFPGKGCNDFNDLHTSHGIEAVRSAMGIKEPAEDYDWRSDLIVKHKDDGTEVVPCRITNLKLIMQYAPEFKGRIRYNEFSAQVAIDGQDIDDVAVTSLKMQLESPWIKDKIPTGDVIEAASSVASEYAYHPIREYLESLTWDGQERIFHFFQTYLGSPADEYHMTVAHSLFVSAVARVMKPGCKVDTMVILQSDQGLGKTRLWTTLFGEFCAEVTSSLNDKDFFSGLRGVWAADFGELDQFSKAETTRIKQIISQTFDHYRPHYGRAHKRFPRQCVFVGGTNHDNWQTDPTGARRFLPVEVHRHIDIEAVAEVRDQLWAEALHRYNAGEAWWRIVDAQAHQDEIYVGDSWEEIIGGWLLGRSIVTVAKVLSECLEIEPGRQTKSEQTRAGNVLRRLGWRSKQEAINGARIRVYRPKLE